MKSNQKKWLWVTAAILVIIGIVLVVQNSNQLASNATSDQLSGSSVGTTPTKSTGVNPSLGKPANTPTKNIVQLTSSGFKPFLLEINRGESVEFLNASNNTMVIKSQTENAANAYPGFSQESGPLGKGGKYYFAFTTPGAWPYYNLNTITGAKFQGVIIVK